MFMYAGTQRVEFNKEESKTILKNSLNRRGFSIYVENSYGSKIHVKYGIGEANEKIYSFILKDKDFHREYNMVDDVSIWVEPTNSKSVAILVTDW